MAFGKRGAQRPVRTSQRSASQRPTTVEATLAAPRSAYGPLGWMVIGGVAVFAVIACINALILMHIGRDFDENWARPAGTQSIGKTFIGKDQLSVQLQSRCEQPKFGYKLFHPRHLSDNQVELARKVRHTNQLTNYIVCSMRTARQRYCVAKARTDLADHIRAYLKMRKDTLRFARYVGSQPKSKHDVILERLARNDNLTRRVIVPDTTIKQVDPRLITGLRQLVQSGYFSKSDFGGFLWSTAPEELAASFEGVATQRAAC